MVKLSIVISCLDPGEAFETTLASVLQNRPEHCEVIVALPCRYADPYDLSGEVRFVDAGPGAGWLELINAGLDEAEGEILHFLEAGLEVEEGWTASAAERFDDPRVGSVAPLIVTSADAAQMVCGGLRYSLGGRRKLVGCRKRIKPRMKVRVLGPTRRAGFYRAQPLRQLGGFDSEVGNLLTDVDLALSLRALGYRAVSEPRSRIFGLPEQEAGATSFRDGRHAERLFWRHLEQGSRFAPLLLHPVAVAMDSLDSLAQGGLLLHLLGRTVGLCELRSYRCFRHRLQEAATSPGTTGVRQRKLSTVEPASTAPRRAA